MGIYMRCSRIQETLRILALNLYSTTAATTPAFVYFLLVFIVVELHTGSLSVLIRSTVILRHPRTSWIAGLKIYRSNQQLIRNFWLLFIVVELHTGYLSVLIHSTVLLRHPRTSWIAGLNIYRSNQQLIRNFWLLFIVVELHTGYLPVLTKF